MKKVFTSNIQTVPTDHPNSFIGDFMKQPELFSDSVKIKYSKHLKGKKREEEKCDNEYVTVTILVSGRFSVHFPETNETVVLEKEGDFLVYQKEVLHTWEALEDSVTMCVRYKS